MTSYTDVEIIMLHLDSNSIPEFLDRFESFDDAVIRRIQHFYLQSGKDKTVVTLSTHDKGSETGWSNVTIYIIGVTEILFREGRSTRVILTNGLNIKWQSNQFWLDFSPYDCDLDSESNFRRSNFYIVGERLEWSLAPYNEESETENQ